MKRTIILTLLLSLFTMATAHAQTVVYYHTDALGTPIAVTDASGNVVERSEYEPYGSLLNRPLTDGPGYTGHVMDAATGLAYMQQRYYDAQIGRFISVDPISSLQGNLTHFSRYLYGNGNPYKFLDPDGRAGVGWFVIYVGASPASPPSLRSGDEGVPRGTNSRFAWPQSTTGKIDMVSISLPGRAGKTYLDSEMGRRVNDWIDKSSEQGVNLSFNYGYRSQDTQNGLHSNPTAITPAKLSLHSAGTAVDVNYSSLSSTPGGLTGSQKREIIRSTAKAAGLEWGGGWPRPDPPHFFMDPGGDRQQLVNDAAQQIDFWEGK